MLSARHCRSCTMSRAMALVLIYALVVGMAQANAGPLHAAIDVEERKLLEARDYLGSYPAGNNDPNPVRRRFLGIDNRDRLVSTPNPGHTLGSVVDELVRLSRRATLPGDRRRIDELLNQATQLSLQGWIISGNISLMEGLRVSYPIATGEQARPQRNPIPYGSLENELGFLSIKDAMRATLFYDEGVRVLLASLRREPKDGRAPVIVDVDTRPIPAGKRDLAGVFENHLFPQYTWYVDDGAPGSPSDDRIIPIQTQGVQMGNLLQKQGQATQSIGHRLWTAAYFSLEARRNAGTRRKLLDAAVTELHAGANTQFLSSIALAATVGDKTDATAEPPYQIAQLHHARTNVNQARDTIGRIRANNKPTLPIDEIMASDAHVNTLLLAIDDATGAPGSIARAQKSYDNARDALFRVHQTKEKVVQDERTRQMAFLHRLEELTGEPIIESNRDDITPETLRTPAGQARYLERVATRVNALMASSKPDFGQTDNQLDNAVKQVIFHRQEVLNKKSVLDSYPQRIKTVEDTLDKNISAIRGAEAKITAAQIAMGIANSVSITMSASNSLSIGTSGVNETFTAGISVNYNPGALMVASLQNDITRASNLKETQFLQNHVGAQVRNLLLDQDQAHGQLKSQVILLRHAEDTVNKMLGDARQILARLRAFDDDVSGLWYNDPIWNIELTGAEEQANRDMASLVANLYKLGRMLEIRWVEPFSNPISVTNGEPVPLGPGYDHFQNLEAVFTLPLVNVRDNPDLKSPPEQARDFLGAMRSWDGELRKHRNFEGDLPRIRISLRQDVFGLADVKTVDGWTRPLDMRPTDNPDYEEDHDARLRNIQRFQNILLNHGLYKTAESPKPTGFVIGFPLRYYDNGFTRGKLGNTRLFGDVNAWNYRLKKVRVRFVPLLGRNVLPPSRTVSIYIAQAGVIENIDFFERGRGSSDGRRLRTYNLDNYVRYDTSDLGNSGDSAYLLFSFAKQDGYPDEKDLPRASNMAGRFWSPFASRWLLQFNPTNDFEIENIDDIWIEMTLTTGQPSCPLKWRGHCQ